MLQPENFYQALREAEPAVVEKLVNQAVNEGRSPAEILDEGLIAGMSLIGKEFKARELWVPDVLLAARNMHRGIEILKPRFAQGNREMKGKVILGTVRGDIHDIGKNLVAIMMSGAGFDVLDLGIDVPAEKFIAAAQEYRPQIIGLSALLTTTMLEMRKVIEVVKTSRLEPQPRVLVGGAPLTEAFAREIGADGYGADAVSGVEAALQLLGEK